MVTITGKRIDSVENINFVLKRGSIVIRNCIKNPKFLYSGA